MPNEEYCKMLQLVDSWSKHDKEYLWESSLKDDAPLYVHTALMEIKRFRNEARSEGRVI